MYLLWILIIFLAIRIVFRWILPLVLPYFLKRFLKKYGQGFNTFNTGTTAPEPEPIKFTKPKSSTHNKEDEYVDFEEIK
ncbi:MAG: DUF4834 domain-containing protein [Bacteroidetes bacterium]|nr:DUF4834 domain-containing protein [Bacteroidota bacterium]